ncbi:hypothetical protein G159_01895 [Planococcus glaciei CHR43]|nr:hypothetical protein G159_01895 [Planococcus glaciei CHR43]
MGGSSEFIRLLTWIERILTFAERILTFIEHILTFTERISGKPAVFFSAGLKGAPVLGNHGSRGFFPIRRNAIMQVNKASTIEFISKGENGMSVKEVLFVVLEEYADWEAASIAAALNEEPETGERKYRVKTVSLSKDPVTSIGGFRVVPDYTVDEVGNDFAGLVLIGGNSWHKEESKAVMALVQKALDAHKVLGAICGATEFLGMNGVLNNIQHTGNRLDELQEAAGENYTNAARYVEQQAVRDGNIITANGSAFLEFGKEVMTALESAPQEEIDEWYEFFKSGYYEFMQNK